MYLLCRLMESGFAVSAAHYNHNLRLTADRDEAFVRNWCDAHRIPLAVGSGDVVAFAAENGLAMLYGFRRGAWMGASRTVNVDRHDGGGEA